MEEQKGSFYVILESDILMSKISDKAKIIYAIVSSYSNNDVGYCFLTYKQITKLVNVSLRQLYRCLNELKEKNYITIVYKNNRAYLMPTINKLLELRKNKAENLKELFNYDWLNDSEKN